MSVCEDLLRLQSCHMLCILGHTPLVNEVPYVTAFSTLSDLLCSSIHWSISNIISSLKRGEFNVALTQWAGIAAVPSIRLQLLFVVIELGLQALPFDIWCIRAIDWKACSEWQLTQFFISILSSRTTLLFPTFPQFSTFHWGAFQLDFRVASIASSFMSKSLDAISSKAESCSRSQLQSEWGRERRLEGEREE